MDVTHFYTLCHFHAIFNDFLYFFVLSERSGIELSFEHIQMHRHPKYLVEPFRIQSKLKFKDYKIKLYFRLSIKLHFPRCSTTSTSHITHYNVIDNDPLKYFLEYDVIEETL